MYIDKWKKLCLKTDFLTLAGERQLCSPVQFFKSVFPSGGFGARGMGFAMDEAERSAPTRVFRALAAFVLGETALEIIGDAGVKRLIAAFENIDKPAHGVRPSFL